MARQTYFCKVEEPVGGDDDVRFDGPFHWQTFSFRFAVILFESDAAVTRVDDVQREARRRVHRADQLCAFHTGHSSLVESVVRTGPTTVPSIRLVF